MERVYLDNNATTIVDPRVKSAMEPFFSQRYGNPNSLHRFGTELHPEMLTAMDRLYAGISADDSDDIIVTGCATEGNNTVLKSFWLRSIQDDKPCRIVTSQIEHPSVARTCDWLETRGCQVTRLPVNEQGLVTGDILRDFVKPGEADLVSIMWANNETGLINPVKELCDTSHELGAFFHTDAVQAVGKVPVDLKYAGVDYLTFSAHKFHGPKGIGGLYIRAGSPVVPLLHGGEQMGGLRAGTVNVPYLVGMGLAMELAVESLPWINNELRKMRDRLEDSISGIPDTIILGRRENRTPNTILASFRGIEGEAFIWDLNQNNIAASTGSACSSEDLEADPTLKAMNLGPELAHTAVRLSLSRFTTDDEIDHVIDVIQKTVNRLRKISSSY